jgi:hypothetical protein
MHVPMINIIIKEKEFIHAIVIFLSLKVQPCAVAQEMQRNARQVMAWDIKTLTWPETSCLVKTTQYS